MDCIFWLYLSVYTSWSAAAATFSAISGLHIFLNYDDNKLSHFSIAFIFAALVNMIFLYMLREYPQNLDSINEIGQDIAENPRLTWFAVVIIILSCYFDMAISPLKLTITALFAAICVFSCLTMDEDVYEQISKNLFIVLAGELFIVLNNDKSPLQVGITFAALLTSFMVNHTRRSRILLS